MSPAIRPVSKAAEFGCTNSIRARLVGDPETFNSLPPLYTLYSVLVFASGRFKKLAHSKSFLGTFFPLICNRISPFRKSLEYGV